MNQITIFNNMLNSDKLKSRLLETMGDAKYANNFKASLLELYKNDTLLQQCKPEDIINEALKCTTLGLSLSKSLGQAYILPYKNKATLVVGYRGLLTLATTSGNFKRINACIVYEGECVNYNKINGEISLSEKPVSNKAIGYIGYYMLNNGYEHSTYMTREEVLAHSIKYSKSSNKSYSPWATEFDAMALKTLIRKLLKLAPLSPALYKALEDNNGEFDDKSEDVLFEIGNNGDVIVSEYQPPELNKQVDAEDKSDNAFTQERGKNEEYF